MGLNSCLYECEVVHQRLMPKRHGFKNRMFMFYLDLDELEIIHKTLRLLSWNRFNLYSFLEADHLPTGNQSLKTRVIEYLKAQGIQAEICQVRLLTNLRVLGYAFNPVSFFLCFDADGQPVCAISEVGNTFGEIKPFMVPLTADDTSSFPLFHSRETKHYYVSPFSALTCLFDFRIGLPEEAFRVEIDVWNEKASEKTLVSVLKGQRYSLNDGKLFWLTLRYPLVTLQVIALIHYQAFRLWLKKVPFYCKEANPELQLRVMKPHASLSQFSKASNPAERDYAHER